jgi:uncharacterized repeat protein (TIGR04042 family)
MPEMRFDVRLPDGREESCYSPSRVIRELLHEGAQYPLYEFMARTRAALSIAAERVRQKYGFHCSAAMDQLQQLESIATGYHPDAYVQVLRFHDKA